MKSKISVTLDKEVLDLIESMINDKKGAFRNRSHVVEYSIKKLLDDESNGGGRWQ
ncbi:MAG: ribbon-helix-helix domain-containing protein [Nanoarchaeota archaeon]